MNIEMINISEHRSDKVFIYVDETENIDENFTSFHKLCDANNVTNISCNNIEEAKQLKCKYSDCYCAIIEYKFNDGIYLNGKNIPINEIEYPEENSEDS